MNIHLKTVSERKGHLNNVFSKIPDLSILVSVTTPKSVPFPAG